MKQVVMVGVLVSVFLFSGLLYGAKVATLTEVLKPVSIFVDNNQLYVTEGVSVHIYSLKDYSYKTRFGKDGEGPQEFKLSRFGMRGVFIDAQTDVLLITSQQKLSFFSKDGKYIRELKTAGGFTGGRSIQPMGNGFVYQGFASEDQKFFTTSVLADDKFNKVKEVARAKSVFQRGRKMNPLQRPMPPQTDLTCNQIVIYNHSGEIQIFDAKGNKKVAFTPDIKKIAFDSSIKERIIHHYKNDPNTKRFWNRFKEMIEYPSHLPLMRSATAADSRIYVLTYQQKGDDTQLLIYDKNGKLAKQTYLPLAYKSFVEAHPFVIRNNNLYQLVENEDEEEWELHITAIN